MKRMLVSYSRLLNKLIIFKNKFRNNDLTNLKISCIGINDDFILNIVNEIKTLLEGYNSILGISSKRKKEVRDDYLKKYVYDSRS